MNVNGFRVTEGNRLDKLAEAKVASAETYGVLTTNGSFSFRYNKVMLKNLELSVTFEDGVHTTKIVSNGSDAEVYIDGSFKTKFVYDTSRTIKIERIDGSLKVWQDAILRYSSSTGFSLGQGIFKINYNGRSNTTDLGINSAAFKGGTTPVGSFPKIDTRSIGSGNYFQTPSLFEIGGVLVF
jgi:hypothetical protein